jgi:lipopolysaccharide/colanic/teichoic acid biosynthesis glycosyltransferase
MTGRELIERGLALVALALVSPLLAVAIVGIRLSSRGPAFFTPQRAGRDGRAFTMFKLRTMRCRPDATGSAITAAGDARVFPFGTLLRRLKIDELPQLWNVVRGEMAIVGPRPEDLQIVREHYTDIGQETLSVRPGLVSPGSLYYYTHCERLMSDGDTERAYVERVLPIKLALDAVYAREASLAYDVRMVVRTCVVIAAMALGKRSFREPPELRRAIGLVAAEQDGRPRAAAAAAGRIGGIRL